MARKEDIRLSTLGEWNEYADKSADEALPQIYAHVDKSSKTALDWYWGSISSKRNASLAVRLVSFSLLVAGAVYWYLDVTAEE